MAETQETVVVYRLHSFNFVGFSHAELQTVGRDTPATAQLFCRHPGHPYRKTDSFVGFDGRGICVTSSKDMDNHIGQYFPDFCKEFSIRR